MFDLGRADAVDRLDADRVAAADAQRRRHVVAVDHVGDDGLPVDRDLGRREASASRAGRRRRCATRAGSADRRGRCRRGASGPLHRRRMPGKPRRWRRSGDLRAAGNASLQGVPHLSIPLRRLMQYNALLARAVARCIARRSAIEGEHDATTVATVHCWRSWQPCCCAATARGGGAAGRPGASAGGAPRAIECHCRANGRTYELGERVCLPTPSGQRVAECRMVQNVTSWSFGSEDCSVSASLTLFQQGAAPTRPGAP